MKFRGQFQDRKSRRGLTKRYRPEAQIKGANLVLATDCPSAERTTETAGKLRHKSMSGRTRTASILRWAASEGRGAVEKMFARLCLPFLVYAEPRLKGKA
jgi:hypothetical protein